MKRTQLITILFSAAAFAVTMGCQKESEIQPTADASRDVSAQRDNMKEETREAIVATKEYAYAQKAEYAAKIRAEMADLNKELAQLSTKIEGSSASAKAEAQIKLQALREKMARLNEKLDGVQGATESTWEEVKAGVKTGYDEVKDSFKQAREWFSDKIAP